MEGKVVGIDPGMTTGWAHTTDTGVIVSGSWRIDVPKYNPIHILGYRLGEFLVEHKPVLVCYEEPVARGMAARSLNRQLGVIIYICELHLIPHYPVNPGTLKKHATGKGNATKEEMAEALWGKGGYIPDDHNAVDAHWLADYARKVVLPTMGTDDDDS